MIHIIESVLDGSARSIARRNFKLILEGHGAVVSVVMDLRSPLFGLKPAKDEVLRAIRKWTTAWDKLGVVLIVKLRMTTTAAPTILSVLENTQPMSSKKRDELE